MAVKAKRMEMAAEAKRVGQGRPKMNGLFLFHFFLLSPHPPARPPPPPPLPPPALWEGPAGPELAGRNLVVGQTLRRQTFSSKAAPCSLELELRGCCSRAVGRAPFPHRSLEGQAPPSPHNLEGAL